MKTIRRAVQAMVCGVCATMAVSVASAETQAGFYVGLSAGESSVDVEKSELDAVVRGVWFSQGVFFRPGSSSLEDSDTSLAAFAGYSFNPYIAIEAGYMDFGTAEYRSTGTVSISPPPRTVPAAVGFDIESKGITVSALGSIPLTDIIDVHGHLGFLFANTDFKVTAAFGPSVATETEKLESVSAFFGAGAGFHFGDHWSFSLDWTRYDNVGDENDDDDVRTQAGFNIDTLSVSGMFRF